jgi:hypothetical protein
MKQRKVKHIGGFIAVLYFTIPQFSAASYVGTVLTLYTVNIGFIRSNLEWLSIPVVFGILAVSVVVWLWFNYIFLYPAWLAFQNRQTYKHDNPVARNLHKIMSKLEIEDEEETDESEAEV